MSEYGAADDFKVIKGLVICKQSGEYLVDLILDSDLNPKLLSSFIGALSLFGANNVGKIEEISIKGLDVDMIIVQKYDLILISIMDKDFLKEEIREELVKLLDMFYYTHQDQIDDNMEVSKFEAFKNLLFVQIQDYLNRIETLKEPTLFNIFTQGIQNKLESISSDDLMSKMKHRSEKLK